MAVARDEQPRHRSRLRSARRRWRGSRRGGAAAGRAAADAARHADRGSLLALYRELLGLRRESAALAGGRSSLLDADPRVLAFLREDADGDRALVAINMSPSPVSARLDGRAVRAHSWRAALCTHARAAQPDDVAALVLRPYEALVLRSVGCSTDLSLSRTRNGTHSAHCQSVSRQT